MKKKLDIYGSVFRRSRSVVGFGLCSLISVFTVSCSPGMFFGKGKDKAIAQKRSYITSGEMCRQIDLSPSSLDAGTFRNLLKCLNSNKTLDEIVLLVSKLTDQELQPVVELINRYILQDAAVLYKLESTFHRLEEQGILDHLLVQFGKFLKNDALLSAGIAVFRDGFQGEKRKEILTALELLAPKLTEKNWEAYLDLAINWLNAPSFSSLQEKIRSTHTPKVDFDALAQAFANYLRVDHQIPCGDEVCSLMDTFLTAARTRSVSHPEQGYFLTAMNRTLFRLRPEELKVRVPELTLLLDKLILEDSSGKPILQNLSESFQVFNRPISCMNGSGTGLGNSTGAKVIPNALMHLIHEWMEVPRNETTDYIQRDLPLTLVAFRPFCTLPNQLNSAYQPLMDLAKAGMIPQLSTLLKDFYQSGRKRTGSCGPSSDGSIRDRMECHPMIQLMVGFMADGGVSGSSSASTGGFTQLIPFFQEVSRHNAWPDLFLFLSSLEDRDRVAMAEVFQFLVESQTSLNGKSVLQVFGDSFSEASIPHLVSLMKAANQYFDLEEPLLLPTLVSFRNAYYSNDVHPVLDILRAVAKDARQLGPFFDTLLKVSDMNEFHRALGKVSEMASDGKLKDILHNVFQLFHGLAEKGSIGIQIHEKGAPNHVRRSWHQLTAKDLISPSANHINQVGCSLELDFDLSNVNDSSFSKNLDSYLNCLKTASSSTGRSYDEFAKAMSFLNNQPTISDPAPGQAPAPHSKLSFLAFQIQSIHSFFKSTPEHAFKAQDYGYLVDRWMDAYDEGEFSHFLEAARSWIGTRDENTQVLKPLSELLVKTWGKARNEITDLVQLGATFLKKQEFPSILADIDAIAHKPGMEAVFGQAGEDPVSDIFDKDLYDEKDKKAPNDKRTFKDEIARWVYSKECYDDPKNLNPETYTKKDRNRWLNRRVKEIIHEALHRVSNGDLSRDQKRGGSRTAWNLDDAEQLLNPILTKIAEEEQKRREGPLDKTILDAGLAFLEYFSHPDPTAKDAGERDWKTYAPSPKTFDSNYLLKWFYQRSRDYRLITYYELGQGPQPRLRVKLVNTLDLFELVVTNVDFQAPELLDNKNLALKFLKEIALAWGDEEEQPSELAKLLDPGKVPQTLLETAYDLTHRPGLENFEFLQKSLGFPAYPTCYDRKAFETLDIEKKYSTNTCDPGFSKFQRWYQAITTPIANLANKAKGAWQNLSGKKPKEGLQGLEKYELPSRLYNLSQVTPVLFENAVLRRRDYYDEKYREHLFGSKVDFFDKSKDYSGGMRVLRKLFYELYLSSPPADRNEEWEGRNNLNLVLKTVRLGLMSQIGRMIQNFKEDDPVLKDFFAALVHASTLPETRNLLVRVLDKDPDSGQVIFRNLLRPIFAILEKKNSEVSGDHDTYARIKQTGFYALPLLHRLKHAPGFNEDLVSPLLKGLGEGLRENKTFLLSQDPSAQERMKALLEEGLASEFASSFVKAAWEVEDKDQRKRLANTFLEATGPDGSHLKGALKILATFYDTEEANQKWLEFQTRKEKLLASSAYPKLEMEELRDRILKFFKEEPSPKSKSSPRTPEEIELAKNLRLAAIEWMNGKSIGETLHLLEHQPNDFYNSIVDIGSYLDAAQKGGIQDFLLKMRRSLSETEK